MFSPPKYLLSYSIEKKKKCEKFGILHFTFFYIGKWRMENFDWKCIEPNWWYCKLNTFSPPIFRYYYHLFGISFKIFFYHILNNFDVVASGTCYRQRAMSLTHHQKYNYFVNSFPRIWKIYASQWTRNPSICARLMDTEYNNYFYLYWKTESLLDCIKSYQFFFFFFFFFLFSYSKRKSRLWTNYKIIEKGFANSFWFDDGE